MDKWDPKWNSESCTAWGGRPCKTRDNYWAGAKKACDELGMSLPDKSKLQSLAKKTTAEKQQLGLPTDGFFWSSSEEGGAAWMYYAYFGEGGYGYNYYKGNSDIEVLCVGD